MNVGERERERERVRERRRTTKLGFPQPAQPLAVLYVCVYVCTIHIGIVAKLKENGVNGKIIAFLGRV